MAEIRIQTRNSIQSPSQVTNSHKPYQTINREQLDEIVAFVKKRRTRTVLEHEKLDILLLQAKLRYKLHEKQKKVGRRQKRKAAITDHVAHLLQRKKELVGNVWRDYWMSQDVRVARPPANYNPKPTIIPRINLIARLVQEFVRRRRGQQQRTTANDVRTVLLEHGIMKYDPKNSKENHASLRYVRRYLCNTA